MIEYVLNFIRNFVILLNIPKQDNLRSYYDCIYTIYEVWKYNEDKLPDKLRILLERLFDSVYYKLIKILKRFRNNIEIEINDLQLEKEYCVISKMDPILISKRIEYQKSLLTNINKLLDLEFPTTEKILVILYNDLDADLSDYIMKNLFTDIAPKLKKEIKDIYREYMIKYYLVYIKNKIQEIVSYLFTKKKLITT